MSAAYRWFVSHKEPPQELVKQLYLPGVCQAIELGIAPPAGTPTPEWPSDEPARLCRQHLLALQDPTAARRFARPLVGGDTRVEPGSRRIGEAEVWFRPVSRTRVSLVIVAEKPSSSATARYRLMKQGMAKADRLRPRPLPRLRARDPRRLFVQGPRRLPVLHDATNG
ncbi:MAG: hypothetical protein EXR72_24365 [Myxococcales bacterium]|nr:hypothetical protein [Myxococcales bacterium]